MSITEEYKLLSNLAYFEDLDATELKRLILVSERYDLDANEYLLHQGENTHMVFAIIGGEYSVLVNTPQGELELNTIEGPDLVGEIGAILGEAHTASIRAKSPGEVIGIESKLFLDTISNDARTAVKTMQLLANRVKQLSVKTAMLNQAAQSS